LEQIEVSKEQLSMVLTDLRLWYDGYLFDIDAPHKIYNPNMVLYFAQEYKERRKYPHEMLDINIASDYSKIQKLFNIQGKEKDYFEILQSLSEKGTFDAQLVTQYTLARDFDASDLTSLLFYMGFLTLQGKVLEQHVFTFPNYAIRQLYGDYFFNSIKKMYALPFSTQELKVAIREMAMAANPKAFFQYIENVIQAFAPRDAAHFTESSLKAIVISLLFQQRFYYIHSEYETDWQFMDLFLEPMQGMKPTYQVALELKYVEKAGKKRLDTLFKEALEQLKGYILSPKFSNRTNIKAWVIIAVGAKVHWRELK
jgi:hypothetical protein